MNGTDVVASGLNISRNPGETDVQLFNRIRLAQIAERESQIQSRLIELGNAPQWLCDAAAGIQINYVARATRERLDKHAIEYDKQWVPYTHMEVVRL